MPIDNPVSKAGMLSSVSKCNDDGIVVKPVGKLHGMVNALMSCSALSSGFLLGSTVFASAAEETGKLLDTNNILMMAVFGGAVSFALMSSFWMIRERSRIARENHELKRNLSDLRARNDRNEALFNMPGQRVVVWNGVDEQPVVLGVLSEDTGAPLEPPEFLSFGKWLHQSSLPEFSKCLAELKENARHFELVVRTRRGDMVETVGGTSGTHAYVRFADLQGEHEEHAKLKEQHNSLKNAFDRVEHLLQRLPMPIWLKDEAGKLSWVNKAYSDAVEADSPIDVVNKNRDLFDLEVREKLTPSEDASLLIKKLPVTVSGDRKKLEVFSVGSNEGSAGLAIDRSEIEETARRLEEANDGHSKLLDQLATAVVIFDKSKKLSFFNSGFQQLWQLDPAFLESGPSNSDLLDAMRESKLLPPPPDWRKWRDGQLDVYRAIEPVEDWWHLMDGQTLRVIVSPRSEGGATWIFENVTERLALESNYNALMRIQGETLDHLKEAVAVFGSDGRLKLFNPALEALWQLDDLVVAEELHITKVIQAWTDGISNETDLQIILGKITGFDDMRDGVEGRMELRDGRTLEYSVVPLPKGQSMLTMVDITANVNFERALRERAEALEASDMLKSNFIQHVSYELRAPLTSISGFGELLQTPEIGPLNNKQEEYLDHIGSAASTLRSLVDDILDLASIDAGTMRLERSEINMDECISGVVDALEEKLQRKSVTVLPEIADDSKVLIADEDRIQQILHHLVANATKFSPDGGSVVVSCRQGDEDYQIRVSDDGPGIDPAQRDKVFDRFEARSATGTRHGAGLGLSLVRGFVELHGGRVDIEESSSGGACVVVSLPLHSDLEGTKGDELSRGSANTAA